MDKIEFKNGVTKANATTMNLLQKNMSDSVEEKSLTVTLLNSWEKYYGCQIFKREKTVHLSLCVRNGGGTHILTLPEGYRPSETIFVPATAEGSGSYLSIDTNGYVYCASADVGKLMTINASFMVG